MNWTDAQAAAAHDEGWELINVIDNGTRHSYLRVWPTERTEYVITRAKQLSTLHIAALQAVMSSRATTTTKTKARR